MNNMNQKIIILVLLVVIVGGFFYYQNKIDTDSDKVVTDNASGTTFDDTVARTAYENAKNQLPHHFTACFATEKLSCTDGDCESLEPITYWLLAGTKSNGTISRCDSQGCDTYDATAHQSGIFENVQPKELGGFLFKRQVLDVNGDPADPQKFVDIATSFLTTVISTGYCIETL